MIHNWFFAKKWLIAELNYANVQIAGFIEQLTEAREEAEDLAAERDELRDQLLVATRTARLLREGEKVLTAIDPGRPLAESQRAELLRLRDTNRVLESRVALLQNANMQGDPHV